MFFNNKGILGINARNLLYIRPYNKKKAIRLADDKIKTKQFLSARDIPVPKLFGIIKDIKDLEKFDFNAIQIPFVLKPNKGFGGEGIIPIVNKKEGFFILTSGKQISKDELKDHILDILDGRFSIGNVSDYAFFEQYIIADERIGKYSYSGLPDIRIVVHNLIPVMAMLRLPTKESEGKANLHLGAVGVGIDISTGKTTNIAYKNKIIDELPNGLGNIKGLIIPYWDEILKIASKVQLITNLGYMAVDICLDKNLGPVLLEINARAGLGVQIANLAPLRKRLERIEGVKVTTPEKGIRIAKDMFGNIVEKEIKNLTGKEVLGTEEEIEIIQKNGTFRLIAQMNTGKEISTIDEDLAIKLGLLENTEDYDDEKSTLKTKFSIKHHRIQTIVNVEKIPSKKYKMIIGSRDLKPFLIDTGSKSEKKQIPQKIKITKQDYHSKKINYYETDQAIVQIDNKIKLLYHLRPINLESEKEKFLKNSSNNPQFEYPELKFDPMELIYALNKIKTDNSPLGIIFKRKIKEISDKIHLLESIDEENFTNISIKLFGTPSYEDTENCKKLLMELSSDELKNEKKEYNTDETKEKFERTFEKYGLKKWTVKIKENIVADCVAGKNNSLFLKANTKFSQNRINALIIHEIETHILTAENGKFQPYEIFHTGTANYLETQEGLAMYNVETQKEIPFTKNYRALSHVVAIYKCINGNFIDAFNELMYLGLPEEQAFRSALKAKRGFYDTSKKGAFTKDYIYYKGYFKIKKFIGNRGNLKDLYIGKIGLDDLDPIKQIKNISKPKILPIWLK